jgi:hypothetical protein
MIKLIGRSNRQGWLAFTRIPTSISQLQVLQIPMEVVSRQKIALYASLGKRSWIFRSLLVNALTVLIMKLWTKAPIPKLRWLVSLPKNHSHNLLLQSRRAWVYQERILSPRVAHFHNLELIFECKSSFHCECDSINETEFDAVPNRSYDTLGGSPNLTTIEQAWNDVITKYSNLELSFQSDKLPALAGIANYFQNLTQSDYLAGTWKSHLPQCLLWYVNQPLYPHLQGGRIQDSCIPTWSWASMLLEKQELLTFPRKDLVLPDMFRSNPRFSVVEVPILFSHQKYVFTERLGLIAYARGRCFGADVCGVRNNSRARRFSSNPSFSIY